MGRIGEGHVSSQCFPSHEEDSQVHGNSACIGGYDGPRQDAAALQEDQLRERLPPRTARTARKFGLLGSVQLGHSASFRGSKEWQQLAPQLDQLLRPDRAEWASSSTLNSLRHLDGMRLPSPRHSLAAPRGGFITKTLYHCPHALTAPRGGRTAARRPYHGCLHGAAD